MKLGQMTPEKQIVIELLEKAVEQYGPGVLFGALGGLIEKKPELRAEATKALAAAKTESAKEGGSALAMLALGALVLGGKKKRGRR